MPENKTVPKHQSMDQFESLDNDLLVNGLSVQRVKQIAGQTPFYVYDRQVIRQNILLLRDNLPDAIKLHYAVKANPMPQLVSYIQSQVDGLDVASGKELSIAINSGMTANDISFAGPGKSENELSMAIAAGITINVESFNELKRIKSLTEKCDYPAKVALRVNPDFELKSSGMKMGGGAQQFGIDAELIPDAINIIRDYEFDLQGLHIFTGSQNLNVDHIMSAHENIFKLADQISQQNGIAFKYLNIGGGLGIPYFPGEKEIDDEGIRQIGDALDMLIERYHQSFADTEIIMELGRYLVGNAGLYVCEVTDIKESRGKTFVIVNGGLHHHLAASGNFGQVIRKNYPVAVANKINQPVDKAVQIVGPLCTPLDILANQYELPKIEMGDLIAIYQSGAYGYTASPRDFLSHLQPVEILV